jgi:hypothetical protein
MELCSSEKNGEGRADMPHRRAGAGYDEPFSRSEHNI